MSKRKFTDRITPEVGKANAVQCFTALACPSLTAQELASLAKVDEEALAVLLSIEEMAEERVRLYFNSQGVQNG